MYIKKVVEYVYNYAEYIVTDGHYDVRAICMSVPLPDGLEPKVGMEITELYVFNINEQIIKKIETNKQLIKHKSGLSYKIIGKVINSSMIEVFDFKFSFYDELIGYNPGDYVEVIADRLDCIVEGWY